LTVRACCSRPPLAAGKAVYGVRVRVPEAFEELRERAEMPRADPTATLARGSGPFEKGREVYVLFLKCTTSRIPML
jgi:hypothetical protein